MDGPTRTVPVWVGGALVTAIFFLGIFGSIRHLAGQTSTTSVEAGNALPVISSVIVNNGDTIILTPNATTAVSVSFNVTDSNGCADVFQNGNVTTTLYATAYVSSSCSVFSDFVCLFSSTTTHNCTGTSTSAAATTTFYLYHFAVSTDASSSVPDSAWEGFIQVRDASSSVATSSSPGIEVASLLALHIPSSSIDYGTLGAGSDTDSSNSIVPVQLAGNVSTSVQVSGGALVKGPDSIPTSSQKYASDPFTYGSGGINLSDIPTLLSGFSVHYADVWRVSTSSLPAAYFDAKAAVVGNNVYHIGGADSAQISTTTVLYAPINSGQSIGPWSQTASLHHPTEAHGASTYDGRIYVLGGADEVAATTTVLYASTLTEGGVSGWTQTTPLPSPSHFLSAVAHNGFLYAIGGLNNSSTPTTTVSFAQINSDGTVGPWSATTPMPAPRGVHAAVQHGGFLYVSGGMTPNSTTSVIFAPINATGSLGAWNLTTRMPLDLSRHSMYVSGDYLYLNGGMWFGGLIPSEFVMFARLLDGGGVGRWTFHNQLIDDTQLHSTVLHNGFAYNLGGAVSSTVTSTVSRTQTMSRNTYWGLSIPGESPAGTYTGTTVFTAVLPP